jgi:cathepsin A (carboxypeptidase C)
MMRRYQIIKRIYIIIILRMIKILALAALVSLTQSAPIEDFVPSLPRMNNNQTFPFKMYSGYLQIAGTSRNLHYMYVESQKDPVNDPVLLWFNGGPGCSSMLGFMQEHGPYVMEDGKDEFHENEWSWNKEANVLYIESPAAVGYSYYISQGDFNFTDEAVAIDNMNALLYFFLFKFPER